MSRSESGVSEMQKLVTVMMAMTKVVESQIREFGDATEDALSGQRGARVLFVETVPAVLDAEIAGGNGLVALGLATATLFAGLVSKTQGNVEIAEPGTQTERQVRRHWAEAGIAVQRAALCWRRVIVHGGGRFGSWKSDSRKGEREGDEEREKGRVRACWAKGASEKVE